jgi:transcriptional regulator with XRE-family HTH domain
VLRAWLADRLRRYRADSGLNQGDVAGQLAWSVSKLQRVETEVVGISVTDTKALLDLYGVTDPQTVRQLLTVARAAKKRDRFSQYRKFFSPEYNVLLSYEESASDVRSVSSFALPGLLQTPRYARTLLAVRHSGEKLEGLVEARTLRQEILHAADAPSFFFVIDEAMLHRYVGGREVLLEQLDHLHHMSELDKVEIRVIPFEADVHLGLWEQFVIMTIPASDLTGEISETIIYREAGDAEHLVRHALDRIEIYEQAFANVLQQCLSRVDSRRLIERLKRELSTTAPSEPESVAR